jgi:hypothetical protein
MEKTEPKYEYHLHTWGGFYNVDNLNDELPQETSTEAAIVGNTVLATSV